MSSTAPVPRTAAPIRSAGGRPAGPVRRIVEGWNARGTRDRALRADLEGLRAVAVVGVVICHLKAAWLPGGFAGVDVFFVLSGFFITSLLLREVQRSGTVDLLAFWGRRARRLLPAAAVVLIATIVASMLFLDPLDSRRFAQDGLWTALFSVNWHFAAQGTDYFANPAPSPMTHFWSLGVEEQFYVVWPFLLAGLAWLVARRSRRSMRVAVTVVAVLAGIASYLLAWHLTAGLQPYAYFATYSRVWQLGLGAALAASAGALSRLPIALRTLARWAGVAMIVGFYVAAPADIIYPGWISIVPTGGAALVVVSGLARADGRAVAGVFDPLWLALRSKVGQLLGRYSYGWYLWHWPPLVILPLMVHHALTPVQLVATALGTLALAVLNYHVLEHPVRSSTTLARRHGRLSLVLGAAVIVAGVSTAQAVELHSSSVLDNAQVTTAQGQTLVPTPAQAAAQEREAAKIGCEVGQTSTADPTCQILADQGKGSVVLMGDSHSAQWMPAVKASAEAQDWALTEYSRDNCPFADVTKIINGEPNAVCDTWRTEKINEIIKAKPSLLVVASYPPPGGPTIYDRTTKKAVTSDAQAVAEYEAGMERSLTKVEDAGIQVLFILDQPRYDQDAPTCVLQHESDVSACSAPQATAQHAPTDAAAAAAVPGVRTLDHTSTFCHGGRCYQVIGNILAYHDNNHLTQQMVMSLEPKVSAAMQSAVASAQ